MELKLQDGKYILSAGVPETVQGNEALLQRALMRLTARRGGFWPDPDYGSRLYSLARVKPSQRAAAAKQFVAEALAGEPALAVEDVTYTQRDADSASVAVALSVGGTSTELIIEV